MAVLAVEKPQENVKEAFSGGQNGRFIPAPKIFYNLFRKDDRPKEDKSWLDRVTDSIINKLELQWEDDEEARMEVHFSQWLYHLHLAKAFSQIQTVLDSNVQIPCDGLERRIGALYCLYIFLSKLSSIADNHSILQTEENCIALVVVTNHSQLHS